ncbi:MAG: recombination mediator RecR [Candidatus Nealsonbacteria bacterium]|nr:recombination mediator RecR [Candidatus Nealsonbacteria bacterium]
MQISNGVYPPSVQKLIKLFSKFPTIGPRTAARFVFYIMKLSKEETEEITKAISSLKETVKHCSFCLNPFEDEGDLCEICKDPRRDKTLLCVIEKETDLPPIEKTKKYPGRYFILGGTLSKFNKEEENSLNIQKLLEKAKNPEIQEIILAVNPTTEGEITTLYLERILKPLNKKTTRLGRGLPVGGELEYADEETLGSALEGRK